MKPQLTAILIFGLVFTGIPFSSHSQERPKTLDATQKAALSALASPGLLRQKAGDGQVVLNAPGAPQKPLPGKWVMTDGQWGWVPAGEAIPTSDAPKSKDGGVTPGGAVLIAVGAVVAVVGILVLTFVNGLKNGLGSGFGGSC